MRIGAKTEYACIAALALAARFGSGAPIRVREIADDHGIPARFLVQILLQLKRAGLVSSTRGASGGYQLIRSPHDVTLADVMAAVEGPCEPPTSNLCRATDLSRTLVATWRDAADAEQEILGAVTLADLLERSAGRPQPMYYI